MRCDGQPGVGGELLIDLDQQGPVHVSGVPGQLQADVQAAARCAPGRPACVRPTPGMCAAHGTYTHLEAPVRTVVQMQLAAASMQG